MRRMPWTNSILLLLMALILAACTGEPQNTQSQGNGNTTPTPSNTPPVVTAGANQSLGDVSSFTLTGGAIDDTGVQSTEWTQIAGPVVVFGNRQNTTTQVTLPTAPAKREVFLFRLTAIDDNGASSSADVQVIVTPPLIINAGSNQTVSSGTPVSLRVNIQRQGAPIQTYRWEHTNRSGALPTPPVTGATEQILQFTAPTVSQSTAYNFSVVVTDEDGVSETAGVIVTVVPPVAGNTPPTANISANQTTVNVGDTVVLNGSGSNDPDGTIVSWNWLVTSTGTNITLVSNGANQVQFVAPQVVSNTIVTVQLTVTDSQQATGSTEINITINGNAVPTVSAGNDQSVTVGDTVNLTAAATDESLGTLVYVWEILSGPNGVNLSSTSAAQISFTAPAVTAPTPVTLRITVTDNRGVSASDTVLITINPVAVNAPPSVSVTDANLSVASGAAVTLSGSANDSDGTVTSLVWSQTGGSPTVTLSNANSATATFTAPTVGSATTLNFTLTATDNDGATGTAQVVVTVNPPGNVAPVANAGGPQTVTEGAAVTLSGAGSSDSNGGTIVSYAWAQTGGSPSVTLTNANGVNAGFIAPTVGVTTQLTFTLTVTDNDGASDTDSAVITINPAPAANQLPTANAVADPTVISGTLVTLDGSGSSDPDGTIVSYAWSQTGTPAVTLNNANGAVATFSAPSVVAQTVLNFTLVVTDDQGGSDSAMVSVTVNPLVGQQPSRLSGTISVTTSHVVDSDVNDADADFIDNSVITGTVQALPNPAVLGGYLNRPSSGPAGASRISGDVEDHYAVSLNSGQTVNLHLGDNNGDATTMVWMVLTLGGSAVAGQSVTGSSGVLSVTAPATDNYVVYIQLISDTGSISYVLTVGSQAPVALNANAFSAADDFVAGQLIVDFKKSPNTFFPAQAKVNALGMTVQGGSSDREMLLRLNTDVNGVAPATLSALGIPAVPYRAANAEAQLKQDTILAAAALQNRPDVESVRLNYRVFAAAVPNDTLYGLQWHFPLINLPQAWDTSTGSADVVVAIIDTGILPNHPDLQGQYVNYGYDFVSDPSNALDGDGIDSDPTDLGNGTGGGSYHGSHVAGTVAAASNNNTGVAGIAWNSRILPLRALGAQGGTDYDVLQAIRYAAGLSNDSGVTLSPAQRADVINLSLGRTGNTTTPPSTYVQARQNGVIIVAAAGNDGNNDIYLPSAYEGVVAVSAVDISRSLTGYSNFGPNIDIAAPGGTSRDVNSDGWPDSVYSTGGSGSGSRLQYLYPPQNGTSMAAPHVAGVAALMKSVYPALTPAQFDSMLVAGDLTQDLGPNGRDDSFGYGLVDAQKAVLAADALAGGGGAAPSPALQVTPTNISFGLALNNQTVTISNSGSGALSGLSVTENSNWLSVTPVAVDASGLGTYRVSVNRTGLSANVYSSAVAVSSNAGSTNINVTMQVAPAAIDDNAGPQVVELWDRINQVISASVKVTVIGGVYSYAFPQIPPGTYQIRSGSDLDNDGVLCEMGESCGAYPVLNSVSGDIVVDGSGTDINNLNFETGFIITAH